MSEEYCPVNGWDCPYYKDGKCICEKPDENCEDYIMFWESFDNDEYTVLEGRSE